MTGNEKSPVASTHSGVSQTQLDFLRGLAAVYVVINHVRGTLFIGGEKLLAGGASWSDYLGVALLQATVFGMHAVVLFFVLSGYAITHSVRQADGLGRFYARRALRIWPPYIAACLLAVVVGRIIGVGDLEARLLPVLFYVEPSTTVTPQFWSLPYEVLFYAIAPFVLATERRVWIMAVLSAAGLAWLWATRGHEMNPTASLVVNFIGNEALFFAIGALLYYHHDRVPSLPRPVFWAVIAVLVAAMWLARRALGDTALIPALIMLPIAVLAIRNVPAHVPRWMNFGRFSYSIYIFHYAPIALLVWWLDTGLGIDALAIRNPFVWVLFVPPVLAACYALYLVTERWSNMVVARLRRR